MVGSAYVAHHRGRLYVVAVSLDHTASLRQSQEYTLEMKGELHMSPKADNVVETDEGWETVVEPYGATWDFDSNPTLIGVYKGMKTVSLPDLNRPDEMRDSNVYEIDEASTGEKVSVWGGYSIDEAFTKISPGAQVRIEFKGKIKIKGGAQEVKQFVVQTRSA